MAKKPQNTKKQHTVPQLYLRPFADSKEKFWAYDKTDGRIFQLGVRDAAQKHGFFSIPELDGDNGAGWFAETYFGKYEDPAAAAIKDLLSRIHIGVYQVITPEIRSCLARFLALQYQRTQAARALLDHTNQAFARMAEMWPNVPQLAGALQAPSGVELAKDHLISGLNPQKINAFAEVLHGHIWAVFMNRTGTRLYTSDNPLALHSQVENPLMGVGIGSYGVELSIPLAPHCHLTLVDRQWAADHAPGFLEWDGRLWGSLDAKTVLGCRELQVRSSYRFIYSGSEDDFELADEMCTRHPEYRNPDHPRMSVTVGGEVIYGA